MMLRGLLVALMQVIQRLSKISFYRSTQRMKAKNEKKLIRVLLIRLNYQIILEILSRSIALYRSGK